VDKFKRFVAVLHARNLEFVRDRAALSWNIMLPVLLVMGFAFMFSERSSDAFKVGVYEANTATMDVTQLNESLQAKKHLFFREKYIKFITVTDLDGSVDKVRRHKLDMLLIPGSRMRYWINTTSEKGYVLERMLLGASSIGVDVTKMPVRQTVKGTEVNYVDWVIPGILAMNIMFSCLFGIGYVIVRYRKMGVLKRFQATPLTAFEFLSAQIVSRLFLIMLITGIVFAGSVWIVGLKVVGSYFSLFIVFLLGSASLISLGLIVAARSTSEEYANGVLNLFAWPMMIFSGVWFSLEGLHPAAQTFSQILPLTHLIDAARAIINDGKGLVDVSYNIVVLAVMTVVFMITGALMFKWDRF